MSVMTTMRRSWHSIAPRTPSDIEEEFRTTLDAYQEDLVRQGLPEEEARRKAQFDLGRTAVQNESYREAIGLRLFDEFGGDIRYGLRQMRHNPAFAWTAVMTLGLGIGATTAIFSAVYALLIRPLPYPNQDRLMEILDGNPKKGWMGGPLISPDFVARVSPKWRVFAVTHSQRP